ncbi:MAG: type III-A CRISPR-associated protein Csm2 [Candidatus Latescibacteria bacterium]|nr:type III-A CRISPR-associated protein Csm2 [Candidatus Latescibacterota bacterium]
MLRTDLRGITDIADITSGDINNIGETQGKAFYQQRVTTSQLRTFYSAVNRIRVQSQQEREFTSLERSLILLKPKLAYAAGRHPRQLKPFREFMVQAIDGVVNSKKKGDALTNFFDLLEAVVAYHKFHGGN